MDPGKLKLIYEAVDHELFQPGDTNAARAHIARYSVTKRFVLFVSSLWPYKNCDGRPRDGRWPVMSSRAPAGYCRRRAGREIPGFPALAGGCSSVTPDVVFVGAVPLEETVGSYRAADAFVYPSLNETFGLPILEAMACGCPVVTSETSAMPETAGGAAVLSDPAEPASIAKAILQAVGPDRDRMREHGLVRASQFTWAATAASTLDVYREVAEGREGRRK